MSLVHKVIDSPKLIMRATKDPKLLAYGLNKVFHQYRRGTQYNHLGFDIFTDADWDNLIVLDACRYDEYRSQTPFDGDLRKVESKGTASSQWVYGNFHGKQCHDTVYVTGNGWYLALKKNTSFEGELHYYHAVDRDVFNGYVPSPENVSDAAREFADRYPNKRLIIHYMQPHKPYLGENREAFEFLRDKDIGLRTAMRRYNIDDETLQVAYRDNLRLVLENVEQLVEDLDGKTVITSDHGEMLGDRMSPFPIRWHGHPNGIYVDVLTDVPWHVVSDGPRRRIKAERSELIEDIDFADVEENLRNLGYKPERVIEN